MANEHSPGVGNVAIDLDGENLFLVPSLDAALFLSRQQGGLMGVLNRCENLEMDVITMVIAQGLGKSGLGPKELPGKIYRSGIVVCSTRAMEYLGVLMNAGKPRVSKDDEEEGKKNPLGNGSPTKSSTET